MCAWSLFVLPFSLVAYAPQGWKTPYIIACIVLGLCLFPCFYIWEAKFAPVQFLPWKYLKNGTIIGSCLLYCVMFLSVFCWNGYFYSYLLVVHRQSIPTLDISSTLSRLPRRHSVRSSHGGSTNPVISSGRPTLVCPSFSSVLLF